MNTYIEKNGAETMFTKKLLVHFCEEMEAIYWIKHEIVK